MPSISTGSSAANPPRQAAILTTKSPDRLTQEQRSLLDRLSISCPELLWMRTLALDFRDALASNDGQQMRCWIHGAKQCGIGSLVRFAFGLQKDLSAVLAAVETPWSNGQVGSDQSSQDHQAPDVAGRASLCYGLASFHTHRSLHLLSKGHPELHQNGGRANFNRR